MQTHFTGILGRWAALLVVLLCATIGCSDQPVNRHTIIETVDWYEQNSIALEGQVAYSHWRGSGLLADVLLLSPHLAVVADKDASTATMFDPNSDVPGRNILRFGTGPGEVNGVGSIARTSHGFAISDATGRRILEFDTQGQLLSTASTSNRFNDVSSLGHGLVATAASPHLRDTLLSSFEKSEDSQLLPVSDTPYPDLGFLSLPEAFPDAMHSWRVTIDGTRAYLVCAGLPVVATVNTSNPVAPTVYTLRDDFAAKNRDFESAWSSGTFPYFLEDVDVDDDGYVFLARSGAWGEHPSGGAAYRIDVLDSSLIPLVSLLVQNHPDRISARGGNLLVGSIVSLFGEEQIQIYSYRDLDFHRDQ